MWRIIYQPVAYVVLVNKMSQGVLERRNLWKDYKHENARNNEADAGDLQKAYVFRQKKGSLIGNTRRHYGQGAR